MADDPNHISFEALKSWTPPAQGTTVAFLGPEADFHRALHGAAIGMLAVLKPEMADWKLLSVDTTAETLAETLKLLHGKKVWSVVFTAPLKPPALKILSPSFTDTARSDEQNILGLGSADATAERVGAINLALWRPTGYFGISTDGAAFIWALEEALHLKMKGEMIFVIGAGALGRAVAVEALSQGCRELWIGNRTQEHAWDALDQIVPSPNMRARVHSFNLLKPSPKLPKNGLIVNALPASVRGSDTAVLDLARFEDSSSYFDTALTPTELTKLAEERGMLTGFGRRMFAWQTRRQVELMTGATPDIEMLVWAVSEAAGKVGV